MQHVSATNKEQLLGSIEKGRAYYTEDNENFYLPAEAFEKGIVFTNKEGNEERLPFEEALPRLFNNCTVEVSTDQRYVYVDTGKMRCRKDRDWSTDKRFIIVGGEIYTEDQICEQCTNYLKYLVNECDFSAPFIWKKQKDIQPEINEEIYGFAKVKKGHITRSNFDEEIQEFSEKHVHERINEFADRGRFVQRKLKAEGEVCKGCIRYKTKICRGLSRHDIDDRIDGHCNITKEQFTKQMVVKIKRRYGSMGKALWYFTQCGKIIDYKDKQTKRTSERYICIPGSDRGDGTITGFEMCSSHYPLEIDERTHDIFISEKEFRELYTPRPARYKKSLQDIVVAAEAYRERKDPGQYIVTSGHTNWLAYAKIGQYGSWYSRDKSPSFMIGAQTSHNNVYPVAVQDIHELVKETHDVRSLRMW